VKEHQDACNVKSSAIVEHAWKKHYPILWQETKIMDRASRTIQKRVKKSFKFNLPSKNQDVGLELPSCWISTLKNLTRNHTYYSHRLIRSLPFPTFAVFKVFSLNSFISRAHFLRFLRHLRFFFLTKQVKTSRYKDC